jgi:hypothetical protein
MFKTFVSLLSGHASYTIRPTCALVLLCEFQTVSLRMIQLPASNVTANDVETSRSNFSLPFTGPCTVIYSYNKNQRDALFLKFIVVKKSTCFGQVYCPSSGV